jgi:hypothetical protein
MSLEKYIKALEELYHAMIDVVKLSDNTEAVEKACNIAIKVGDELRKVRGW